MFAYLKITILASIAICGYNGQETCLIGSGSQGECVSITKCSSLLNVLRQSETLPASETIALRNSQCGIIGTTPKVCCPKNIPAKVVDRSPPIRESIPPPDVTKHSKLRLINSDICGPVTESKIILGNKTTVLEFPWMALIGYKVNGLGIEYQCGGTLINKRYVLTAGHCVTGLRADLELAGVRIGDHDLNKEVDCDVENGVPTVCADKYQDFLIERFHTHTNYRTDSQANDIALIRINKDADFQSLNVRPICLPIGELNSQLISKKAIVTGWGRTERGFRSQELLKVKLEIVPNDECANIFEANSIAIGYKQLCAGGKNRKDSCAGDSGGPLQYPGYINGVPKYIQYGIVSFGTKSCGVEGYPGVYTRVSYYMDWILDTIVD